MKQLKFLITVVAGLSCMNQAFANGFTFEANLGLATPHFSDNVQNVTITPGLINQYTTNTPSQFSPLLGLNLAYHWDFKVYSISLGADLYNMQSSAGGINSPFINSPNAPYDSLTYSAEGSSTALMLAPKFILTKYHWQPYVLIGGGVSLNHFYDYSEMPTDPDGSARATQTPFAGKTQTDFAYEAGIGIQYALGNSAHAPILSLDYRYINWGSASLGDAGAANSSLNLGKLSSGVAILGISWPF